MHKESGKISGCKFVLLGIDVCTLAFDDEKHALTGHDLSYPK